ncbi:MAG: hypothetical protein E2576_07545 [Alcaligenaceae bacterium]|nr:hypothetical protein [Alcaligenaceae bacterium SAGV5]MPS55354.1 hypothetical protein [Alcaligenaceae bacterium SAGV3]MPT56565.1 hypothetical protein [Alcaligenaceae bacterium]
MSTRTLPATGENRPGDSAKNGKPGPGDPAGSGSVPGLPEDKAATGPAGLDEEERTGSDVLPDEVVDEERLARSHPGDDEDDATRAR